MALSHKMNTMKEGIRTTMKRKRRSNEFDDNGATDESTQNPWIVIGTTTYSDDNNNGTVTVNIPGNDILDEVLRFMDLTKQPPHKQCDNTTPVVEELIAFIRRGIEQDSSVVSMDEVAKLLLPWTTKQLVYQASNEDADIVKVQLYWNVMSVTLEHLLRSDDRTLLSQTLNQSVLNKLVLFAAQSSSRIRTPIIDYSTISFVYMINNLYRPTTDLAAKSLLVQISLLAKNIPGEILSSTIGLLKLLLKDANPKKTFSLFCEPPVLEAMAILYKCGGNGMIQQTNDLLWEIFFSPTQHLDGFRSIQMDVASIHVPVVDPKTRLFHCYQEDLTDTIQQQLLLEPNPTDVIHLIPLLVQGFISNTQAWERNHKSSSGQKKSNVSETASLQFKFWVQLARPLLQRLEVVAVVDDSTHATRLIIVLRETVELVIQNDLYLPSFQDKDQHHFLFLQTMLSRLMDMSSRQPAIKMESLRIMEILVKLNHHVVHNRLPQVITYILASNNNYYELNGSMLPVIISTIVETYHQLRQLDFLFVAIVETVTESNSHDDMIRLNLLLKHPTVVEKLTCSIVSCPHGQISQLFTTLNSWIVHAMKQNEMPNIHYVAVVSTLFVVLIRNVSVDQHSAPDISELCTTTLTGSVTSLLEANCPSTSAVRKYGLALCGWTLDLKTRCAFWLGDGSESANIESSCETSFLPLLNKAVDSVNRDRGLSSEMFGSIIYELQFLACFRVQQLHSLIHKRQQQVLVGAASQNKEDLLFDDEAHRLVNFILASLSTTVTDKTKSLTQSGWKLLSKFVHLWVHYAEPIHLNKFVEWMVSTIVVDVDEIDNEALKESVGLAKVVVTSLFRDASFIEIDPIFSLISKVGIAQLADIYQTLLYKDPANTTDVQVDFLGVNLICSVQSSSWEITSTQTLSNILKSTDHCVVPLDLNNGAQQRVVAAKSAIRLLSFLNGHSGELSRPSDLRTLFESSQRLLILSNSVLAAISTSRSSETMEFADLIVDIVGLLRGVVSRLLMEDQERMNIKTDIITSLIFGTFHHTLSDTKLNAAYFDNTNGFQERTNGLLECAAVLLTTGPGNIGVSALIELVEPLAHSSNDHSLLHPIVSSLLRLNPKSSVSICVCFEGVVKAFKVAVSEVKVKTTSRKDIFLTDLLRLASTKRDEDFREIEKLVQFAAEDPKEVRSIEERAFLLACLVDAGSGNDLIEICEHLYTKVDCEVHNLGLLDAVFGTLVRQEDDDECGEISDLLERLESLPQSKTWIVSHIFYVLVKNVEDTTLRATTIAKYARRYFFRGLQLLRRPSNIQAPKQLELIKQGQSLVIELTRHKDIINVRERDLALLLSLITLLLGPVSATTDALPSEIFATSYNLISTLLQRFPKQLYTCAPSLISALRLLLRHTLYSQLSEAEVESRAHMLSRLCEFVIPHKDVFKKHVIVLVLEYIQALKSEMTSFRKRATMPAIFSLLETLSLFEQQQLNALTNATGKILFSSVYTSYQKGQYKGQY